MSASIIASTSSQESAACISLAPTFIQFPFLPAYEFYSRSHFPWLAEIEQATPEIQAEFQRVFAEDRARSSPTSPIRGPPRSINGGS